MSAVASSPLWRDEAVRGGFMVVCVADGVRSRVRPPDCGCWLDEEPGACQGPTHRAVFLLGCAGMRSPARAPPQLVVQKAWGSLTLALLIPAKGAQRPTLSTAPPLQPVEGREVVQVLAAAGGLGQDARRQCPAGDPHSPRKRRPGVSRPMPRVAGRQTRPLYGGRCFNPAPPPGSINNPPRPVLCVRCALYLPRDGPAFRRDHLR